MRRTLTLQLFTNPDALRPVGRHLLAAFFNRFHQDLAACDFSAPNPDTRTPHYFTQVVTMLKSPAPWPETFEQALLAIEQMAQTRAGIPPASADILPTPRTDTAAETLSPLRAAILLWLGTHPTDIAREIENAIEADRLRIEEDKRSEAQLRETELREQKLSEDALRIDSTTPEPARPEPCIYQPSTPQLPT